MITQNVDNDILKLDYSETLKLIDKYSNIQYIYNLNKLFKTSSNKYKDFKKTIENKKQVYEKLISSNITNVLTEEEIFKINQTLETLKKQKEDLSISFNSIPYDIKNPKTIIILETDYEKLLKQLELDFKIITDDEYNSLLISYNELKYLLKDIDQQTLLKLKSEYNPELDIQIENISINKPCDLIILENEEKFLTSYLTDYKINDTIIDLNILKKEIEDLKHQKDIYDKEHSFMISIKPLIVEKPSMTKEECLNQISKYFNSVQELHDFINKHKSYNHNKTYEPNHICDINYQEYKKNNEKQSITKMAIGFHDKSLITDENNIKTCIKKQQSIIDINKPITPISYKTTGTIKRALNKINIQKVLKDLENEEIKLKEYYSILENISKLENELLFYNQELVLLTTNDEYKYNPHCVFCCKRPWVNRINELNIIIKKYHDDISLLNKNITDNNYLTILKNNETNNKLKSSYQLLTDWYDYYKNKELKDKITSQLNDAIKTKENTLAKLSELQQKVKLVDDMNNFFIYKSFQLYQILISNDDYIKWDNWNIKYNKLIIDINDVSTIINKKQDEYYYNNDIRPRIFKYYELKKMYDEWEHLNNIQLIVRTHKFFHYKLLIDTYEKYKEYNRNLLSKLSIQEKIILNDKIKIIDKEISSINDNYIKKSTINSYNKDNKDCYIKLCDIYNDIDTVIDTLDIILINFHAFKINLYDKFILNKLKDRTNAILKSLCHKNTKPFNLDYYISICKDTIHINWLINTKIDNDNKQIISINQASGFQHFAISLALRMSLFNNKNEILCNQLFIDEGFVNFDKYNLSIVPSFLKSLLSYFNNIILVSHIDLIQDNIDEFTEINYNKSTSVSHMNYSKYKKTITKKRN